LVVPYLFAPLRLVALGVFLDLSVMPILSWFFSQPLGIEDRLPVMLGLIAMMLLALSKRVIAPKTPLSQSMHSLELFFNRLLFDRDIRDRESWIRWKSQQKPES
jgi:glycerol-3-phosphate acyltransferase PlsY